ncbi:autotransporter outer membrane beta-barrel domain-containing protein [Candidimonas humi]|uniref:Autotransporter outer membrane beta-barrel domain-containing protein n=1 Tax=Candidimonas humi TaxID=683355 RepID=A0ABV8NW81_9BURK|nr:autotransporter outer membrane beta-barrel domain-containing protein [Candidimonas humi]MBV6304833.1 autotransporter outer membrane beta-barrel domain-containing protein [Candidimonas humi]
MKNTNPVLMLGCVRDAPLQSIGYLALGFALVACSSAYGQFVNETVTSGTVTESGYSYDDTVAGTAAIKASGTGVINLTDTQATGVAGHTNALMATAGGQIFMHGGSATLGDNAIVSGNGRSPAVYAYNGGSITLDQGAQVNIGQTSGPNALGNGVTAYSTNGSATTVNLDDVTITRNQNGYVSGNTGRYLTATGAGASIVANNVTTGAATTGGIVAVENQARMTITNSTLNQANVYNLASGTSGPATMLSISDTAINGRGTAPVNVLGTSWVAANTVRGSTTLTNVSIAMDGDASSYGGVYASGIYGAGVMADTTSDIAVHGGLITTSGVDSMGIEATDNSAGVAKGGAGAVTVDAAGAQGPASIQTSGAGAYGAYANLGGTIAIADASISTSGANADGLRATLGDALNPSLSTASVAPAAITMTGGSVTTTGAGANGVSLDGGTSVGLNGVAVHAAGSGVSITDANQSGKTNTVTMAGGALASQGDAFVVNGASAGIDVSGTAPIVPASGNLLNLSNGATATFTATGETLNGNIVSDAASSGDVYLNSGTVLTGMVDPVSMTIDASSRWNVTASSVATDLSNAGTIAFAAPADPDNAAGYSTLTARNYVGNNGTIILNTKLGADNSPSNKLIIDGGSATGTTTLLVKNTNGAGAATTGDGIVLVDAINGATTSPGAFKLGSAVSVGAYDYNLNYQNLAKSDQSWYLRSIVTPSGPALSPAAQTALPYADVLSNFAQATLGTLQQRTGNRVWTGGTVDGRGTWGRVAGQYSSYDPKSGSPYTQGIGFLQAGYEGVAARRPSGELTMGAYAIAGTSSAHIDVTHDPVTGAARPGGKITSTGTGLGLNATWLGKNGLYADAVGQFTWYDSDLSNKSGTGNQGWSGAASLELGKRFGLGSGWALVPQTQLAWTHVDFDSYTDNSGNKISLGKGDSLQGRIGVRVEKQSESAARDLQLYGIANLEYEFLNGTSVEVSGTTLDQRNQRLWGEVGAGATYVLNKKWSLYAEADYATALSGGSGNNYSVRGTAGLRYRW